MRKLRVLVLMHEDLVPPDTLAGKSDEEVLEWKTEYDVSTTLAKIGHDVRQLGVQHDLRPIRESLEEYKPHVAFNLLEEFHSVAQYDQHVVSFLELMRQPYTGCNPRGLLLAHDKALCKKLLTFHRISTPWFLEFPLDRAVKLPAKVPFPLLVKSVIDDASLGISQASIVHSAEKLKERVRFIHENIKSDALAEEYIEGREFYVGVMGNHRLQTFPIWELLFTKAAEDVPRIATRRVKWDLDYQQKLGVKTAAAEDLAPSTVAEINRLAKRVYKVLNLTGYARVDFRMSEQGRAYVLEANPNPNLSHDEDFAMSGKDMGISYKELLKRIVNLGLRYRAAWQAQ
jgi:D-alanine-D-alanine ligase